MKILIVEGSKMVREKLIRYLELENLFVEVLEANSVYEAVRIMKKNRIDIILFDIQLPEVSGLDIIPFSRKMLHQPVLVLITNYKYPQYLSIYENMSVNYIYDKTSELPQLKALIKKLVYDFSKMPNKFSNNKLLNN